MDGILIIDKPAGITSHDVVDRVRRILKTKQVGHTGTLDPFATGVLVLLIGKATRLAQFVVKATKEYVADIRFGFSTDTGDLTGKPLGDDEHSQVSAADIERVLPRFRGEIEQTPPMYSAKKIEGKKLYELARKGEEIERDPSQITVHQLGILAHGFETDTNSIRIRVVCSAGTYIRTLAEDIGKEVGVGAHLAALRRTAAGEFELRNAITLGELESAEDPSTFVLPIEMVVSGLPRIHLAGERVAPTLNGMATRIDRGDFRNDAAVSMFDPEGSLIAVGVYDSAESCIKPKIVLG